MNEWRPGKIRDLDYLADHWYKRAGVLENKSKASFDLGDQISNLAWLVEEGELTLTEVEDRLHQLVNTYVEKWESE